eukprot:scaffold20244_cov109-Isochrysis_galbana.AAC.5
MPLTSTHRTTDNHNLTISASSSSIRAGRCWYCGYSGTSAARTLARARVTRAPPPGGAAILDGGRRTLDRQIVIPRKHVGFAERRY